MGAAALGFARKRTRRTRIRREPIDLERIAAEFADAGPVVGPAAVASAEPAPVSTPVGAPVEVPRSEREILVALEAEVERVRAETEHAIEAGPVVEPAPPVVEPDTPVADPFGICSPANVVSPPNESRAVVANDPGPVARPGITVGLPLDQVRAWLEQVQDDLRKVEARVQYLQAEQTRLQGQHQLVAELISSSTPV